MMVSSDQVDVPHDGAGWRLLVHIGDHELGFEVQHSDGKTWLTAQRWHHAMPDPKQRRNIITASARAHGWVIAHETWPRMKSQQLVLTELFPLDWERIVKEVTSHRGIILQEAARADRVWRMTLIAAHTTGNMSNSRVAAAADVDKSVVHRLHRLGKVPDAAESNFGALLGTARTMLDDEQDGSADG